jgi:hypothetical protein
VLSASHPALAELEAKHPVLMLVLTPAAASAAADSTTGGGRQKLVQMAQQQYEPLARRYQVRGRESCFLSKNDPLQNYAQLYSHNDVQFSACCRQHIRSQLSFDSEGTSMKHHHSILLL